MTPLRAVRRAARQNVQRRADARRDRDAAQAAAQAGDVIAAVACAGRIEHAITLANLAARDAAAHVAHGPEPRPWSDAQTTVRAAEDVTRLAIRAAWIAGVAKGRQEAAARSRQGIAS